MALFYMALYHAMVKIQAMFRWFTQPQMWAV